MHMGVMIGDQLYAGGVGAWGACGGVKKGMNVLVDRDYTNLAVG